MNDFDAQSSNSLFTGAEAQQPASAYGLDSTVSKTSSSSISPVLPASRNDVLRYEAEDLQLSKYIAQSNDVSSGGKHITLFGSQPGTATGVFDGESGTYQVSVGIYDESDGLSSASVTVGEETQSFEFDQDLPSNGPTAEALTTRVTHSTVNLQKGDTFKIEGKSNFGEFARFDYIEFTPIDSDAATNGSMGEAPADMSGSIGETPTDVDGSMGGMGSETSTDMDGSMGGETPIDMGGSMGSDPVVDSPFVPGDLESMSESVRVDPFVPTGTGKTYYVSPNGSDSGLGTKEQPWKTISYATSEESAVGAGDTILVQAGTYIEIVDLEKSGNAQDGHIVLKADGDVTLIDPDPNNTGGAAWHEGVIESVGQSYWVVDGFRIENSSFAGISLRDADNMVVQNNHTFETGGSGVIVMPDSYFEGGDEEVTSSNIKVFNNTIEKANNKWAGRGDPRGVQEALSIWGVDGFDVAGNVVNGGTREGIDVKTGSRNGSVRSNIVTGVASIAGTPGGYNGGPAIYVEGNRADTFNVDVYDNIVYDNVADGIVVADEVPEQGDVKDVRVFNNVVYGNGRQGVNGGVGIAVTSNVSGVEVTNNTVANNVQALVIDGADYTRGFKTSDVTVRDNIFADSTYRNGAIEDANNVTLENNLFTDDFESLYEGSSGLTNFTKANNLQVDSAGFVDPAANNYRLTADSAAVDAGSGAIPVSITTDKDGNPRRVGAAVDIGAFEFDS